MLDERHSNNSFGTYLLWTTNIYVDQVIRLTKCIDHALQSTLWLLLSIQINFYGFFLNTFYPKFKFLLVSISEIRVLCKLQTEVLREKSLVKSNRSFSYQIEGSIAKRGYVLIKVNQNGGNYQSLIITYLFVKLKSMQLKTTDHSMVYRWEC